MCDYSLMNLPNRLVAEGEVLMTHRFPNGSVGLASPEEVQAARTSLGRAQRVPWWKVRMRRTDARAIPVVCAVCIPPGALLRLYGIPEEIQRSAAVSAREEVTFTEVTASQNRYRDAVRFMNGREVLLQRFGPGVGVQVLETVSRNNEYLVVQRSPDGLRGRPASLRRTLPEGLPGVW